MVRMLMGGLDWVIIREVNYLCQLKSHTFLQCYQSLWDDHLGNLVRGRFKSGFCLNFFGCKFSFE